jgi:putative ABC transport system permease protein
LSALSMTGGICGVVGGIGFTWVLSLILTNVLGAWRFDVEGWSVVLGLALALVTGIVFGLVPAWRASRLKIVDALRSD